MEAIVMVIGLFTGTVSETDVQQYLVQQPTPIAHVQVTQLSDEQINRRYMTPDGWDPEAWADAVRSINLDKPAYRR